MTEPPLRDLLAFLEAKVNHLMFSLHRTRRLLKEMQQRSGTDAATLGRLGEALASVSDSERVLADIQQRLDIARRGIS